MDWDLTDVAVCLGMAVCSVGEVVNNDGFGNSLGY